MNCAHLKEDGSNCQAHRMHDSEYCYLHNPDIPDEEKQQARQKGGKVAPIIVQDPMPAITITSISDIPPFLNDIINRVSSGRMEIRVANTLGMLSGMLVRTIELAELEHKMSMLNKSIANKGGR